MISPSFMRQVYRTGGMRTPAVEVQHGQEGGCMRRSRGRRWQCRVSLVAGAVALLASTACGARLDHDQVAALNGRGGSAQQGAPAQAAPVKAAAPSATTTPAQPGQPVAADPGAAAVADPGAGGAPPPAAEGGCTPSGGNLDVGITDSSVTVASVATITGPVPGLFRNMQ